MPQLNSNARHRVFLNTAEVASLIGISKQTILNWMNRGIIIEPQRNPVNNYRQWSEADVLRIRDMIRSGTLIRIVIANQRGGVSKTTTTHTLARLFADQGKRVLLVDTDSQGSLGQVLGLKPIRFLHEFIVNDLAFEDCIVKAHERIDVLCSNRENNKAEISLQGMTFGELAFMRLFGRVEKLYDVVLIDVAPSINILQTCAMVYTKNVLIPVAMDVLSLQGPWRVWKQRDC